MVDPPEDAASDSEPKWKEGEEGLRRREVNQSLASTIVQLVIAVAAVVAVLIAAVASFTAGDAIDVAKQGIQSQADENRLSTAADAISKDTPTARVAGLTLLRRHAEQRLANATDNNASASDRRDALSLFRGTVEILATFLKTPAEPSPTFGIGDPRAKPDMVYAENDLAQWLQNRETFLKLAPSKPSAFSTPRKRAQLTKQDHEQLPNIDLALAELYGAPWRNIDFSWLGYRFFARADLRNASLANSRWGKTELTQAHLGCAHLENAQLGTAPGASNVDKGSVLVRADLHRASLINANLRKTKFTNADLSYADLRGAKLNGADLTNANLTGAKIADTDFTDAILDGTVFKGVEYGPYPGIDEQALLDGMQREPPPVPATPEDPDWDPACTPGSHVTTG
jgi:uncharacterized protein YjbI with pentapeptide repeats